MLHSSFFSLVRSLFRTLSLSLTIVNLVTNASRTNESLSRGIASPLRPSLSLSLSCIPDIYATI